MSDADEAELLSVLEVWISNPNRSAPRRVVSALVRLVLEELCAHALWQRRSWHARSAPFDKPGSDEWIVQQEEAGCRTAADARQVREELTAMWKVSEAAMESPRLRRWTLRGLHYYRDLCRRQHRPPHAQGAIGWAADLVSLGLLLDHRERLEASSPELIWNILLGRIAVRWLVPGGTASPRMPSEDTLQLWVGALLGVLVKKKQGRYAFEYWSVREALSYLHRNARVLRKEGVHGQLRPERAESFTDAAEAELARPIVSGEAEDSDLAAPSLLDAARQELRERAGSAPLATSVEAVYYWRYTLDLQWPEIVHLLGFLLRDHVPPARGGDCIPSDMTLHDLKSALETAGYGACAASRTDGPDEIRKKIVALRQRWARRDKPLLPGMDSTRAIERRERIQHRILYEVYVALCQDASGRRVRAPSRAAQDAFFQRLFEQLESDCCGLPPFALDGFSIRDQPVVWREVTDPQTGARGPLVQTPGYLKTQFDRLVERFGLLPPQVMHQQRVLRLVCARLQREPAPPVPEGAGDAEAWAMRVAEALRHSTCGLPLADYLGFRDPEERARPERMERRRDVTEAVRPLRDSRYYLAWRLKLFDLFPRDQDGAGS